MGLRKDWNPQGPEADRRAACVDAARDLDPIRNRRKDGGRCGCRRRRCRCRCRRGCCCRRREGRENARGRGHRRWRGNRSVRRRGRRRRAAGDDGKHRTEREGERSTSHAGPPSVWAAESMKKPTKPTIRPATTSSRKKIGDTCRCHGLWLTAISPLRSISGPGRGPRSTWLVEQERDRRYDHDRRDGTDQPQQDSIAERPPRLVRGRLLHESLLWRARPSRRTHLQPFAVRPSRAPCPNEVLPELPVWNPRDAGASMFNRAAAGQPTTRARPCPAGRFRRPRCRPTVSATRRPRRAGRSPGA